MISLAARFGPVLAGRPRAKIVRLEIERELHEGASVVVDLEGVVTMSPSFADELFGKLPAETDPNRLHFEHLSEHLASVAQVVTAARNSGP